MILVNNPFVTQVSNSQKVFNQLKKNQVKKFINFNNILNDYLLMNTNELREKKEKKILC